MNIDEALRFTESELESITSQDKINYNGTRELAEEGFRKILAAMFPRLRIISCLHLRIYAGQSQRFSMTE